MRPETIIVETENGPLMINKTDFDPAIHRLPGAATDTAIPDGAGVPPLVVPAAPAAIDANGNPVNVGDGGQMVPPLATEPSQTPAQAVTSLPQLLVTKNAKKRFVAIDMATNTPAIADDLDAEGYKTEAEAWDAIKAHNDKLA